MSHALIPCVRFGRTENYCRKAPVGFEADESAPGHREHLTKRLMRTGVNIRHSAAALSRIWRTSTRNCGEEASTGPFPRESARWGKRSNIHPSR